MAFSWTQRYLLLVVLPVSVVHSKNVTFIEFVFGGDCFLGDLPLASGIDAAFDEADIASPDVVKRQRYTRKRVYVPGFEIGCLDASIKAREQLGPAMQFLARTDDFPVLISPGRIFVK